MSEIIHTCYISDETQPPIQHDLPECSIDCDNINVDDIKVLDDQDKNVHKRDISLTSYLNEHTSENLYENMQVDDSEDIFFSDDDLFFLGIEDMKPPLKYYSQNSVNLLDATKSPLPRKENCTMIYENPILDHYLKHDKLLTSTQDFSDDTVHDFQTNPTFQGIYITK